MFWSLEEKLSISFNVYSIHWSAIAPEVRIAIKAMPKITPTINPTKNKSIVTSSKIKGHLLLLMRINFLPFIHLVYIYTT